MVNMCIAICVFLIKPFLMHDQNVMIKIKTFRERKELLRLNKKHFNHF